MRRRSLFLVSAILIIAIFALLVYSYFFQSPSRRAVIQFVHHLFVERNDKYINHLAFELLSHPFIDLVRNGTVSGCKVLHSENTGTHSAIVWISLEVPEGRLKAPLTVNKRENHWYIASLPEIKFWQHGFPVEYARDEKGAYYDMEIGGSTVKVYLTGDETDIEYGKPIEFTTLNGTIIEKSPLERLHLSRVMSLTHSYIEDMLQGYLPVAGDFPVYREEDSRIVYLGNFCIPSGISSVTLYGSPNGPGRVAVISHVSPNYERIRVVLNNSEYSSLLHPEAVITCKEGFTVKSIVDGISLSFNPEDTASLKPEGDEIAIYKNNQRLASAKSRWYIEPQGVGRLKVVNIKRYFSSKGGGTAYRGILEAAPLDNGITLVNEVALEEYLYSVVPSEMPLQFGMEALKVQAIAARSYAARSMNSIGFAPYGAHLDDSTASQVYNNIEEQDIAVQAVRDTAGLVPMWDNEIVDTRFFSTSPGYTANYHEVWSNRENEFPSEEVPYLRAAPQYPGNAPSLHNEKNFRAFLNNWDLDGYDKFSPLFRWQAVFSRRQLEAVIEANLSGLQKRQPQFILTRGPEGVYQNMDIPVETGELLNIEVLKRGEGGNIMELEITMSHGTFKIIKEYNVRQILKPVNLLEGGPPIELECHDGSVRTDFPLLPSAFAYVDFSRDSEGNIENITVVGGGYGHGVGMSQYGTYGLTLMGKAFDEIIYHYYPGSELKNIHKINR
jgi:stage II sporulation protein D